MQKAIPNFVQSVITIYEAEKIRKSDSRQRDDGDGRVDVFGSAGGVENTVTIVTDLVTDQHSEV